MLAAWVLLLLAACSQGPAPTRPRPGLAGRQRRTRDRPDEAYPELFQAVQESRLFSDQKHFVDALPLREPARIRADYLRERERPGFDLRAFVGRNFEESGSVETAPPEAGADLASHISDLWPALTRHYEQVPARQPAAAAETLRGPRRTLPRGVLLGLLLHHARPCGERAASAGARHARQLRLPDRYLRAHSQR